MAQTSRQVTTSLRRLNDGAGTTAHASIRRSCTVIGQMVRVPLLRMDGKDRKAANFVFLPKGGGSRSDVEAALKPLLNKHGQ